MADHLLPLSALHAVAPGVLDVIFGPDGDFEGAPRFLGPVWDPIFTGWDDLAPATWRRKDPPEEVLRMALDLRVPSIAARLAGLCAQALGKHGPSNGCGRTWEAFATCEPWDPHPTYYALGQGGYSIYRWDQHGRFDRTQCSYLCEGVPSLPFDDGIPRTDEALLAALTLSLAPQIAALGGGR